MKKSIFLFFAAILCATSAWAYDASSAEIYYDNTKSQWSDVQLFIGKSDWNSINPMTKITNTNNLYCLYDFSWGGYSSFYFTTGAAGWDPLANNENVDDRSNWATCRSARQATSLNATVNLYISTAATKGAAVTRKQLTDYKSLNYKQTVQQQLTTDGSTYSASTEAIATIKVASYRLASATATSATAQNGTIASGSSSANCEAARTATVTYSVSGINSSYSFVGWYDGDTQKSTSATYTYQATEAKTITARFAVATEEEHEVAVSYMCGTTKVADGATAYVGVETEKSFTAPTNITGYKFTNWTIGAGIDLKAGTASDATITVVTKSASSDYTLVANYEEVLETVYFINTIEWARVNIHKWEGKAAGSSWPGEKLTASGEKIGVYDVYAYTAKQGDYAKIIFNSKTSSTDGGNAQTADLDWTAGKYYIYNYNGNTGWYTKEDAEALLVAPVVEETVYFVNNKKWTKVQAYAWNATGNNGWPGATLTTTGEKVAGFDVYSYTAPQGYANVIFNNKTGDSGEQSADFVWNNGKYYYMDATANYEGGTAEEVATALAAPVVTYDYYVIGTINNWGLKDAAYGMTDDDADGVYEKVITLADGKNQLKINKGEWKDGEIWGYDQLAVEYEGVSRGTNSDDNNIIIDITPGKDITVKFDKNTSKITLEGLTEKAPAPTYDYYIAGTLAGGWSATQQGMTKEGDVYKATFSELPADIYEFKITDGTWDNPWNYNHLAANYVGVEQGKDGENPNGNIKIITEEALNITILFNPNALYPISIEGLGNGTPIPVFDYYVVGTFNEWTNPDPNNGMTLDGTVYKATVSLKSGDNELKVTNGTWAEGTSKGYSALGESYEEVNSADGDNIKITLAAGKDIVVVYNATTGKITFEGLTPYVAPLTYTVTVPAGTEKCYIVGAFAASNWNTFVEMDKVTGENNKFTITITGAKESDGYKYARGEGWEYVEVKENGEGIDNRAWTANDVVAKWADIISYVLMGVNHDWTTGIPLTKNGDNEYMLLNQTITRATDAIKVVTLTNGTATAWCGDVDSYSDATYTGGGEDNIVLEDGIYDFYFKVSDEKIYIDQTTLLRTGTNKYGTIYIPYTPASVSGATFYQVAGKGTENGQDGVYLESVDKVEAGKPYIYERTGNQVVKIVFSGEKATNGGAVNGLIGTDTKSTHVPVYNYILINNTFCKTDGSSKVRGYRAYLDLNAVTGGKPQPMPGRRYIGMSVQGENETTGVEDLFTTEAPAKVIENGQLIIIREGVKYNVQGQKL